MTDDRSFERAARSWLEVGPTQAPTGAVEAALLRIETTPQQRGLRIPWRFTDMSSLARAGVIAAIGVLAIGGAALLAMPRTPGPAGVDRSSQPSVGVPPSPSGSPSKTTEPSPSPTSSALESSGLIVFEHSTPGLGVRVEYLQPNGLGKELLPDLRGNQETPAWASDGSHLAFAAWDPRDATSQEQIWETDATGAAPRLITKDCTPPACRDEFGPAYSSDGKQMAFIRFAGALGGPPTTSVIAIRDLATGQVTELDSTRTPAAQAFVEHPRWAPDSTRLVYSKVLTDNDGKATDSIVSVVDVDGSHGKALTTTGFEAGDAEWSPDGSRILFARELVHHWFGGGKGSGENTWIYTMAPDGSTLTQLTSGIDGTGAATWTAGGSQILYNLINQSSGGIGTPDIYVMAADGSDPSLVARYGDCCRWYPVQQPTP